jgi:protein-S-isoprenylcysteine O-methyltransferase Ste14
VVFPRIVTGVFGAGCIYLGLVWDRRSGDLVARLGISAHLHHLRDYLVWRLSKLNPELVRERNLPADKAEAWDRVVMGIYSVILVVSLIVSALDGGRYRWSAVPLGVQMIGWILLVVAGAMVWHVVMTNAYLASWARIQDDRGQVVVQGRIYRRIRHPMYLGIIAGFPGIPLVLNSWWAMIPSVVIIGLFVYRTHREDQMLIDGLAGYAEYTEKVRYRLLPGYGRSNWPRGTAKVT